MTNTESVAMPYSPQDVLILGKLGVEAMVLPSSTRALEIDELFRADRNLRGVVIEGAKGPALLTREQLEFKMSGRLGFGRALNARSEAADMLAADDLVVSAELGMSEAVAAILERPEATRYQDILVLAAGSPRIVPVSEVFEGLSDVFRHASMHDPLTGLPNRRMLEAQATALTRDTDLSRIGILFIDLDDFKGVNDTYGHRAGDAVLAEFAARLSGCVRPEDGIVRLGGDEFAVLLVGVDENEAGTVAGRVLKCMDEPFVVDRFRIDVTATLGLAMAGDVTGEEALSRLDALLRHADGAMLHAKLAGKRRVGRIRRGRAPSSFVRDALIRRRLPRALEDGALTLHYQPLRDLATGVDHGVEALLRWTDVELGPVPPAEFVPVAEHTGEILRIGAWVIDRACAQARSWADAGTPLKIAVNVSPVQLAAGTLDADIMGALELHGIPAGLLEIEITEGTAILDLPGAATQLQQLIDAGLGVVLDDYGTAQASLATLLALPLTRVKIAKNFIDRIDTDPRAAAIVRGLIRTLQSVGIKTTAESVERTTQLAALRDMACDTAQGSLISPPVPSPTSPPLPVAPGDEQTERLNGPFLAAWRAVAHNLRAERIRAVETPARKFPDVVPAESTPVTSTSFLMAVKRNGDGDET
ncbi:putative bifunctional diguanylate cyclase/phosphodiesterase [Arthrobacter sp. MMS18-M83]|uniref:putative bifunctional diguanylate cyclase/phosphodiesterase n=1 Tax=Arthrobacter sp. MMS18-M83 TaxID=2996261 RepID=UPI00227D4AF4|nr:EAL domain-containing protein [Arthrobacter sp. MMS18-M83]WAH98114.1 EAL domain-containing protein [Arthrobacter sp. MMS18-M83]